MDMYIDGSGVKPFFHTVTSSGTLTLPTGVPCVITTSANYQQSFNGKVYLQTMAGLGEATVTTKANSSYLYIRVV